MRTQRMALVLMLAAAGVLADPAAGAGYWSPAELVGPNDRPDSIFPNVEVSPDGTVWIVWSSEDPAEEDTEVFYVTVRDFVQSPAQRIHENNRAMDRCPLMSMGSDGVPWVVWERYGQGYEQVVSHWAGEGWSPPETVLVWGSRWDEYTIHAPSSDDVWVARSSVAGGRDDRDIFLRHWDGTSWGEIEQLGVAEKQDYSPELTTDREGRTWLAWLCYRDFSVPDIVYVARHDVSGWGAPVPVDSMPGNVSVRALGVCPDGRPIVVWWWGDDYGGSDLKYATLENSGWQYRGLVNDPDGSEDGDASARLTRASNGDLWVVWKSSVTGEWDAAITASRWTGDGWSEEELVSAPDTLSLCIDQMPDVALAADGRVWTVWERQQEESPYDTDVFTSYRDVVTAVEVWDLAAAQEGDSVRLSWRSSPGGSPAGFHVWRASGAACGGALVGIPDEAARLTETPIQDCTQCSYVDSGAISPGTYCYWMEGVGEHRVYGPATISVSATPGARVSFAVLPNPTGAGGRFEVGGFEGGGEIRIHTVGGRLVRTLRVPGNPGDEGGSGAIVVPWDGLDSCGRRMPSGVYYASLHAEGAAAGAERLRFVMLR